MPLKLFTPIYRISSLKAGVRANVQHLGGMQYSNLRRVGIGARAAKGNEPANALPVRTRNSNKEQNEQNEMYPFVAAHHCITALVADDSYIPKCESWPISVGTVPVIELTERSRYAFRKARRL